MSKFRVREVSSTSTSTSSSMMTSRKKKKEPPTYQLENISFSFPSNICFAGVTGSGKTKLLIRFLELHKSEFHRIFVFCGLGALSGDYDWCKNIYRTDDMVTLEKIFNMQERLWTQKKCYRVCIIFDDFVGTLSMVGGRAGKLIDKVISQGRHAGISVIFLTQKITKYVTPLVRSNSKYWFITQINSGSIMGVIHEEQSDYTDKFQLLDDYNAHRRSLPYGSMLIQNASPSDPSVMFLEPIQL